MATERTAAPQIATPAGLEVVATCPNCNERAVLFLSVTAALEVETDSASLKLKAKSKKVDHVCGQIPLPIVPEGQRSLEEIAKDARELGVTSVSRDDDGVTTIEVDAARARPRSKR